MICSFIFSLFTFTEQGHAVTKDVFVSYMMFSEAGLNGLINGKAKSSSASSTPSPVLIPPDQTKSLKTSPKPALNQLEEKTRHKTKDEVKTHLVIIYSLSCRYNNPTLLYFLVELKCESVN